MIIRVLLCAFTFVDIANASQDSTGQAKNRFIDKGDGTVFDSQTGLMWTADADVADMKIPWQEAMKYIDKMNGGELPNFGYSDWRMPTIEELGTLMDKSGSPDIPPESPFTDVKSSFYWSSSTGFNVIGYVWLLDMENGNAVFDYISYCNFQHFWPVRGSSEAKTALTLTAPVASLTITSGDVCTDKGKIAAPADITPPTPPSKLSAEAVSMTEVALSWSKSEGEKKIAWYNVYDKDNVLVKTSAETFVTVTGLKPKTSYCFNVAALDAAGYESEKVNVCVATREKMAQGTVWSSGINEFGQIGDGTNIDRFSLVRVSGLEYVKKVSGGLEHAIALKSDGTVWAWGRNDKGQLGDGTNKNSSVPVKVKGIEGVIDISAGGYHTLALKSDGTVWGWGRNYYGQLGTGSLVDSNAPVKTANLDGVTAIAAGGYHSMAVRSDGTLWTWGWNLRGQLGIADEDKKGKPKPVKVDIKDVRSISAGMDFSMAAKSDGTVWTWGYNKYGQLGDESIIDRSLPVEVKGVSDVSVVSAGAEYSAALKKDGTVWAWGRNEHGQAGSKTEFKFQKPVKVEGIEDVVEIAAGSTHVAVLKKDKTVWAWGWRLVRDVDKDYIPTQISGLTDIASVSAGKRFTVAVKGGVN